MVMNIKLFIFAFIINIVMDWLLKLSEISEGKYINIFRKLIKLSLWITISSILYERFQGKYEIIDLTKINEWVKYFDTGVFWLSMAYFIVSYFIYTLFTFLVRIFCNISGRKILLAFKKFEKNNNEKEVGIKNILKYLTKSGRSILKSVTPARIELNKLSEFRDTRGEVPKLNKIVNDYIGIGLYFAITLICKNQTKNSVIIIILYVVFSLLAGVLSSIISFLVYLMPEQPIIVNHELENEPNRNIGEIPE